MLLIDEALLIGMSIGIGLGLAGWLIHLYTLIRSAFSTPKRWTIRILFNEYHEAIPEVIIFTSICIFYISILLLLFIELIK